jgi:hypothetical protein
MQVGMGIGGPGGNSGWRPRPRDLGKKTIRVGYAGSSKITSRPAAWVPARLPAAGTSSPPQRASTASRSHAVPSKNRGFAPAWSRTALVKVNCWNSSGVTAPRSSSS